MESNNQELAGVLLAAGQSRRFGVDNKLLVEVEGVPMVRRVAETLLSAGIGRLIVVLGHEADKVSQTLKGLSVRTVVNPNFEYGMGSSLAFGVRQLEDAKWKGALVCLADLPFLCGGDVRIVCDRFWTENGERIVAPVWEAKRGHPVAFPHRCFEALSNLEGDVGARNVIESGVALLAEVAGASAGCVKDLDTRDRSL